MTDTSPKRDPRYSALSMKVYRIIASTIGLFLLSYYSGQGGGVVLGWLLAGLIGLAWGDYAAE